MLKDKIDKDLIEAQKEKDAVSTTTLRFLKSDIQNYMIEKKLTELKDEDILPIVQRQIKRRGESIEQFKKGKREDLAEKEASELKILKAYMPEELSADELKSIVKAAIEEIQPQGKKDFGKVMKAVMEKAKGRAEGKIVSKLVNELLGG